MIRIHRLNNCWCGPAGRARINKRQIGKIALFVISAMDEYEANKYGVYLEIWIQADGRLELMPLTPSTLKVYRALLGDDQADPSVYCG